MEGLLLSFLIPQFAKGGSQGLTPIADLRPGYLRAAQCLGFEIVANRPAMPLVSKARRDPSIHFLWEVSRDSTSGWYPKQEKSTFRGKIARCSSNVAAHR